ncbi:MAG: DUF418 domain-containing protein [Tannerellaceae bacterium]
MKQEKAITIPLRRITVIDALRGFALLGVIVTHMLQHYGIFSFSAVEAGEALFPEMDAIIQWLLRNVIMGKFINIFAFLFGLSFFIQMDSAAKKGVDFRQRFLWRMAILFIIGMVGNCFYTGDILSIYAVFGVLMVALYRVRNRTLILLILLLLVGVPRITTATYELMSVKTEQVVNTETRPSMQSSTQRREEPSFLNSAKENLTRGLQGKMNYQFGFYGRGYLTLALFIFGFIVGRLRFFEEVHLQRRRNGILFVSFVVAIVAINIILGLLPEPPSNRMFMTGIRDGNLDASLLATMALIDIKSVLFSGALSMGFITLYQIKSIGRCLNVISPYGRMGLTNYEMQSVIGCLLFSAWGCGSIFGHWGTTAIFVLALIVYALQVVVSKYWLKCYLYGPLEWLWRSVTYLKLQPFNRTGHTFSGGKQ